MCVIVDVVTALSSSSNEKIGRTVVGMLNSNAIDFADLGSALSSLTAADGAPLDVLPTSESALDALTTSVYDAFSGSAFNRRKVATIADKIGMTVSALKALVAGNSDFTLSTGRRSGIEYISIRGTR